MTQPGAAPDNVAFASDMPVAAALAAATSLLARAGLETPGLDARILVEHALGVTRGDVLLAPQRPLGAQAPALRAALRRRLAREPVARIVGVWEFWGLLFELGASTLVPRPDTETLVEAALAEIGQGGRRHRPLRIVDLGTGSGAILVALLHELPQAFGVGIDVSGEAVALARRNAARNGVDGRAGFAVGRWTGALAGPFDLVVCNPPYIESGVLAELDPEVRCHDPRAALDGGADGLDAYRAILPGIRPLLGSDGAAVFEVGAGQAGDVAGLFAAAALAVAGVRRDLNGIERALLARAAAAK